MNISRRCIVILLPLLLSGCAGRAPDVIRYAPVAPVTVSQVRADPVRFRETWVRWGGNIVSVENRAQETRIEVLSRHLDGEGYPEPDAAIEGRFIARIEGFLDPAQYAPKRLITVVGRIEGSLRQAVGEYPYLYPLVEVRASHLWPVPQPKPCCPPHPWYDPWYPWRHPYGSRIGVGIGF